ncbi:MAG: recombination regulator RecX [Odoribacteraceae bacterium]|jgi:regulatory protein|nr:recombination regulator RecX [Odoribacteraceae bacterium]
MNARKALQIIAARCSRREYSSFEIRAWLLRRELTEEEITSCMIYLQEHHFVNDERFAMAYARDQFRFKRWGRLKIEQALRRKQLPGELVARAIASLDDTGINQEETCLYLLQQKAGNLKEDDPYKRKAKLFRFASGRGFDFETILRALETLDKKERERDA